MRQRSKTGEGSEVEQLLRQASALSYRDGFRVMGVLLLLTIPAVWIMRKPRFKAQPGGAE